MGTNWLESKCGRCSGNMEVVSAMYQCQNCRTPPEAIRVLDSQLKRNALCSPIYFHMMMKAVGAFIIS